MSSQCLWRKFLKGDYRYFGDRYGMLNGNIKMGRRIQTVNILTGLNWLRRVSASVAKLDIKGKVGRPIRFVIYSLLD